MNEKAAATRDLVRLLCRALDDKKADDLQVLDVSGQSSITDFLVIATATSEPHLRALRVEVEKVLDQAKAHIVGMDAPQGSGWLVIDAFDIMLHLFTAEMRERYKLERLWRDAIQIPVATLLAPATVAAGKKPRARKPKAAAAPKRAKGATAAKPKAKAKAKTKPAAKPRRRAS
jgi:ribosome-associated protein